MFQQRFQHLWVPHGTGFNDHDKPGRWMIYPDTDDAGELWTFLRIDLDYDRDRVATCLDFVERFESGQLDPLQAKPGTEASLVDRGNDGALFYGNGHLLIASSYADASRVVMTAEQFMTVLRHVLQTMDHPNYRNPDTEDPFEPLTVELIAQGEGSLEEYYKRGGITPTMPDDYT